MNKSFKSKLLLSDDKFNSSITDPSYYVWKTKLTCLETESCSKNIFVLNLEIKVNSSVLTSGIPGQAISTFVIFMLNTHKHKLQSLR